MLSFGFIAWLPYTKMMHLVTAPLNIYTANLTPLGATLKNIDFEQTGSFGVNALTSFTWKDLVDFDACTECGAALPFARLTPSAKNLSPRDVILQLRDLMHERPLDVFGLAATGSNGAQADNDAHKPLPIIGAVPATSPAALWQCTTCAACMEACPVFIEQMPKIVDMRRYLVMEEADFPTRCRKSSPRSKNAAIPTSGHTGDAP